MQANAHRPIQLRVDARLAAQLPKMAAGRSLAIDHFASRRCAVTVGDLRVRWRPPKGDEAVAVEPVAGVPIVAEPALLPVLASGASLRRAPFGGLRLELDRSAAWLDFLEAHPATRR